MNSGGWLTEHKLTNEFENKISNYLGRKYAIAVPNGTIAIYLALMSLGIKRRQSCCSKHNHDRNNQCNFMDWSRTCFGRR